MRIIFVLKGNRTLSPDFERHPWAWICRQPLLSYRIIQPKSSDGTRQLGRKGMLTLPYYLYHFPSLPQINIIILLFTMAIVFLSLTKGWIKASWKTKLHSICQSLTCQVLSKQGSMLTIHIQLWEQLCLSPTWLPWYSHCEKQYQKVLKKIKNKVTIWPNNPSSWYLPQNFENLYSQRYIHLFVHAALFIVTMTWRQPKCSSIDNWIKIYIYYI